MEAPLKLALSQDKNPLSAKLSLLLCTTKLLYLEFFGNDLEK